MTISLTVPRNELVEALKLLRKHAKKKGAGEAILSYESGMLTIQISGVVARAEAHGDWSGEARIPGKLLALLGSSPPPGDPVEFSVTKDSLHIGSLSFPCVWQQKDAASILLPLDAPLPVILITALKYSQEQITKSGLSKVIANAEEKRDELIGRAAKVLKPLGISREELGRFVNEQVRRNSLYRVEDKP